MRVALTKSGLSRVIDGFVGQLFEVDHFTDSVSHGPNKICHVRDYRYGHSPFKYTPPGLKPFQIWTLGVGDWESYP